MAQSHHSSSTYHVHIYFGDEDIRLATRLREHLATDERVTALGRMHTGPIGPHPCRQFQVLLTAENLEDVLGWVDTHREGLSVLIHPDIDDDLAAHTTHARWLGEPVPLMLERFQTVE